MKFIKEGIYQINRNIVNSINLKHTHELKKSADKVSRLRSRVLYHSSTKSNPQHMFICFSSESLVEVSMHTFAESFLITNGIAQYRFYSKRGKPIHDIRMSPAFMKGSFYAFISQNVPHRFFPLSKHVLANEVGHSSFSSKNTSFGTKNEYKNANKVESKEIAIQAVIRSNQTYFLKKKSNLYMFESKSGIAELSYGAIENLVLKSKKSFCLIPSPKMLKRKKALEKFFIINGLDKIKIYLENSIINCIYGNINIVIGNTKYTTEPLKLFAIGPIKKKTAVIKNLKKDIAIIHVTTEQK